MKKILGAIVIFLTVIGTSISTEAKVNIGAVQNGGYTSLSYQDKCDTVTALVNRVKKDLGIVSPTNLRFYEWAGGREVAYAYQFPAGTYNVQINIAAINELNAGSEGLTVEQYLVKVIAHEVRHIYQDEHMNDDTDYGRACKSGNQNYISYDKNFSAYQQQFVERDADAFGLEYSSKFVKVKKPTQLIANDGKIFDPVFYANKYPDVKNTLGTDPQVLLNHYNIYGIKERRLPNGKNE